MASISCCTRIPEGYLDTLCFDYDDRGFGLVANDFDFSSVTHRSSAPLPPTLQHMERAVVFVADYMLPRREFPTCGPQTYFDVAEVMGGRARTLRILVRRHYRGGRDLDDVLWELSL